MFAVVLYVASNATESTSSSASFSATSKPNKVVCKQATVDTGANAYGVITLKEVWTYDPSGTLIDHITMPGKC